jgi:hypothetical protein
MFSSWNFNDYDAVAKLVKQDKSICIGKAVIFTYALQKGTMRNEP